jgi:hypothetical protein
MARNPWAADANPAPLPTATHLQPLRGSDGKAGYIDLSPVGAGLVKRAEEWQWWSVHHYTAGLSATFRPNRNLAIDRVLLPARMALVLRIRASGCCPKFGCSAGPAGAGPARAALKGGATFKLG